MNEQLPMMALCLGLVFGTVWAANYAGVDRVVTNCEIRGYFVNENKLYRCLLLRELPDEMKKEINK